MQMIEIAALENGAHNNQTFPGALPEGWAVIPDDMPIPATYPFVKVTAENGVVTGMTANQEAYDAAIAEKDKEPETGEDETAVTWAELAAAYNEGVNSIDE